MTGHRCCYLRQRQRSEIGLQGWIWEQTITESLLEKVWGLETDAEVGTVWVYISYLRKRLQALKVHVEIQAKRGIGYQLVEVE